MSDLTWQSIRQRLPVELQLEIAEEIIFNTPAIFIFDVDVDADPPHPRSYESLPQNSRLRFWPVVNPPANSPASHSDHVYRPGIYESQVNKIIRRLLDPRLGLRHLLCKQFAKRNGVITVPNGTVYFNPKKHVTCIRHVNYIRTRPIPWTNLNFDVNRLLFMGRSAMTFCLMRSAFPRLQWTCGVEWYMREDDFSEPNDIICPSNDKFYMPVELLYALI